MIYLKNKNANFAFVNAESKIWQKAKSMILQKTFLVFMLLMVGFGSCELDNSIGTSASSEADGNSDSNTGGNNGGNTDGNDGNVDGSNGDTSLNITIADSLGGSNASEDIVFTLTASSSTNTLSGGEWSQVNPPVGGPFAQIANPNAPSTEVMAYVDPINPSEEIIFRYTKGEQSFDHMITVNRGKIDLDGDGLIEIRSLAMLHNMRYNLEGTSYKTSETATGITTGAVESATIDCTYDSDNDGKFLCGYVLLYPLSFDKDGSGNTWSGSHPDFTLDVTDSQAPYFVVNSDGTGGWLPIGDGTIAGSFSAIFDGNGNTITGLATVRDQNFIGFLGSTNGTIRNIGLVNNLSRGAEALNQYIGGLAGSQFGGSIIASYTTGPASGNSAVGGLVGQSVAKIIASYTTGDVSAEFNVGGLTGTLFTSANIIASYTTGNILSTGYSIFRTARAGGLVGYLSGSNVVASYTTGLVSSSVDATGANGLFGDVINDATYTDNYALGTADTKGILPNGVASASELRTDNVGLSWNSAGISTADIWDFTNKATNTSAGPALRYADYDGTAGIYHCDNDSTTPPSGANIIPCSLGLIPGQL